MDDVPIPDEKKGRDWFSIFEQYSQHAVALISLVGFVFIVLSYIYELGYFCIVGIQYMGAMSTIDYLHHSTIILSLLIIAISIQNLYMTARSKIRSETMARLRASSLIADHERLGVMKLMRWLQIAFLLIIGVMVMSIMSVPVGVVCLAMIIFTIIILFFFKSKSDVTVRSVTTIALVMIVTAGALIEGMSSGIADLSYANYTSVIELDNTEGAQKADILRLVGGGALYMVEGEPGRVRYSPWEHVSFIEDTRIFVKQKSLFDYVSGLFTK